MERLSEQFHAEAVDVIARALLVEEEMQVPLLRSEAVVLGMIKADPGHPVKYYLSKSKLSSRWFHKILGQLVDCGMVSESRNPKDSRQKILG